METKKCNDCGNIRELSAYSKDKRNKDGLQGQCLLCKKIDADKRKVDRRNVMDNKEANKNSTDYDKKHKKPT